MPFGVYTPCVKGNTMRSGEWRVFRGTDADGAHVERPCQAGATADGAGNGRGRIAAVKLDVPLSVSSFERIYPGCLCFRTSM